MRVAAAGLSASPVDWVALDTTGRALERGCSPLSQLPATAELELVIPARMVALHTLELPAGTGKHEAAVIRQQLEDRVLGELTASHIVKGERLGSKLSVWLVSRDWLLSVLAACGAAGLVPARVLPEQALLAAQSFAETEGGFVYRTSTGACGTLPEEALLEPVCGEALTKIENLLGAPRALNIDLLQGLPSLRQASRLSRPQLKLAGFMLLALAGIWLLSLVLSWRQLASQETALREAIRQNFAAANPGVPIIDPILQWRQLHGKQAAKGGDALDQLAQLAEQAPVAIHPTRIEAESAALKLTLSMSDAELLKPVLHEKNIGFDIQTTDNGLQQITISRTAERAQP
ncbi:hypothetical protein GCM10027046_14360 [Uliginosibacterium flavum]